MTVPDWTSASPDETVVWQGRPRQRVVLRGVAVGAVLAAVVLGAGHLAWGGSGSRLALAGTVSVAAVAFAVPTLWVVLWRRYTRYVLTDAGLYHRSGAVWITVTELALEKVQNTAYAQGAFGTLFDHGTVTVDTAGSEGPELRLRALDGPGEVHRVIAAQAGHDDEARAIPGTVDQWRAVLDEVRRARAALDAE